MDAANQKTAQLTLNASHDVTVTDSVGQLMELGALEVVAKMV